MSTGTPKVVYFNNDLLNELQKREGSFSGNVNDLLRKGLLYETEGKERTVKEIIGELIQVYSKWEEKKKK